MSADPVLIARDLLRCRSVTPAEGGALAFLEGVLRQAGFTVHRMTFREPGTDEVENLYARIGAAAPNLLFAGHTDVVPPGDENAWKLPPFSGEVARGRNVRARRGRHERWHCVCHSGCSRSSGGNRRETQRIDFVPDHR